jgi:formyltetrahydrofolate deformylase
VSGFLSGHGCNISDAQQFGEPESGRFFMRVVLSEPPSWSAGPLRADSAAATPQAG